MHTFFWYPNQVHKHVVECFCGRLDFTGTATVPLVFSLLFSLPYHSISLFPTTFLFPYTRILPLPTLYSLLLLPKPLNRLPCTISCVSLSCVSSFRLILYSITAFPTTSSPPHQYTTCNFTAQSSCPCTLSGTLLFYSVLDAKSKTTTPGIPTWSPTVVLTERY